MYTDRIGNWIQTHSGARFYPADPRPGDFDIADIAHALSNLCRYGGHSKKFYSVAEHSVYVSRVVAPRFALVGLLHDATEAYLVDVPRPIKKMLPAYEEMEDGIWAALARQFELPCGQMPLEVKEADTEVLLAERDQVLAVPPDDWSIPGKPADIGQIKFLAPEAAKKAFLDRYQELELLRGLRGEEA
jgi:hypothetical protein